jgi:SAM-dependent methyltransferase
MAGNTACSLLDVGCGPAALRPLLNSNVDYYGIDIAIHQPATYLREVDIVRDPITFEGRRTDFVVALGLFEYLGQQHGQKLEEIRGILKDSGKFIMSYVNFEHYRRQVWPNYNNVQPVAAMVESVKRVFHLEKCFPVSHHWRQKQPGKRSFGAIQMHVNFTIPLISPLLAVEYFFVCSRRR